MDARQQLDKWQQVADLIQRLGLVSDNQDGPRTAAQVARMTTRQLLQDPVRAAIYNRGWEDRTLDIQRRLQPQRTVATPHSRTPLVSRPPPPPATTPAPVTPVEPTKVPGSTGVPLPTTVKGKTEAQLARNRKKFQQLKEKRKAREREASQQHRLAKQPAPTTDPEAPSSPPSTPIPSVPMEVDSPAAKDEKSEEPEQSTNQVPTDQPAAEGTASKDDWLEEFEGMPEMKYDKPFFTPATSPDRS